VSNPTDSTPGAAEILDSGDRPAPPPESADAGAAGSVVAPDEAAGADATPPPTQSAESGRTQPAETVPAATDSEIATEAQATDSSGAADSEVGAAADSPSGQLPAETIEGAGKDEPVAAPSSASSPSESPSPADLARAPHRRPVTPVRAAVVAPAVAAPAESELARASRAFGRVDTEGRVFVLDGDTERELGRWQAGEAAAGLDFYVQRHLAQSAELDLVEQRLRTRKLGPGEALSTLTRHERQVETAPGVGDLPALRARTAALRELAEEVRAERAAEKAAATERARVAKEAVVAEAEKLGGSNDWRGGVARFRVLLAQWKELPRLDRATDDALWHRFSAARTTYTRRRKVHFGELTSRRDEAKGAKESLLAEAEGLAGSTEWAETGKRMRTLMDQWKAAGGAAREVDEQLWQRFRTAQDTFFAARTAHFAQQDAEFAENAKAKEALLVEAEALLPVRDVGRAKGALRAIQDRWNEVGKVPRESVRPLEQRMRAVEQAVETAETRRWQRSNPEMRARAESTVRKLRESVGSLERQLATARAAADDRKAAAAEESLAARRSWLVEAERALADYSD
jgi:t-SNARE complex subunit (syntaxin)